MDRRIAFAILIGTVLACGDDETTAPQTQDVTVTLDYVEVLGACEGVADNPGDFVYTINIFDETGNLSLTTTSTGTGLPGVRFTPPETSHTMQLRAEEGNTFRVELRGTESDSGVPDVRFDDQAGSREHVYQGGVNWDNGARTITVAGTGGAAVCGLELGYTVTVA